METLRKMALLKRNARQGLLGAHDAKRHREAGWRARMQNFDRSDRCPFFLACRRRAKRSRRGPTTTCYRSRWKPATPTASRWSRFFPTRASALFQFRTPAPKVAGGPGGGCRLSGAYPRSFSPTWELLAKVLFQCRSTARDGQGALPAVRVPSPARRRSAPAPAPRQVLQGRGRSRRKAVLERI